ncbi:MAG: gfo/Idh/MocA family oxidoreductase, partial [Pirellulaceae bacterium]
GHHQEWITACKTGAATTCNFDYSGALTEAVLLGNVAFRAGEKLQWDAENLKTPNCPEADRFVRREYRKGWSLS